MKKTIHTLLTAALFATANMSAMPVVAEDGGTAVQSPKIAKQMSLSESSGKRGDTNNVKAEGVNYNILKATTKSVAPVYGPAPTTTVNTTALVDVTTTTVQPVYGTQPTTQLTSTTSATNTGTSITDTLVTATTTTVEILYGPVVPRSRLGDVNEDGDIDIFDLVALRKLLVSGISRSFYSDNYADVNFDRKVNIADLVLLQQYLLGKIDNIYDGDWDFMRGKTIEQITTEPDYNTPTGTTTTTTTYDPRTETIVTLYGVTMTEKARQEMINPNRTTKTTAEQPKQSEEK